MTLADPKHGVTGPVSCKESSLEDIERSKLLEKYLRDSQFFESEDDAQTRERVLGKLDFMLKKFVAQVSPDKESRSYGGKIFTFGSYRLGVHDKGADIDVLCVVPRHVVRKDFFTIFYETLSKDPNVTELSKVEEAYAPLIKLKFQGIPIDMTFARLNLPVVKETTTLLNDNILKSMDEKCITSLNGSRVTDAMLHLVPNIETFHTALRAIKFWAKRRCIYGNTYGYFGGVAYSISVARICQMYPNACSYEIVAKYFEVYSTWKWPAPVLLCPIVDHNFNVKVWDPKVNPADKYHRMPVITPVYPARCATHNITQSTFNAICAELQRSHEKIKSKAPFSKLFEFSDFFKQHKMFVEIAITAESEEHFNMWEGYCESKIRILATKLENLECIVAAIPFPKSFQKRIEQSGSSNKQIEQSADTNTFSLNQEVHPAPSLKISTENAHSNSQMNNYEQSSFCCSENNPQHSNNKKSLDSSECPSSKMFKPNPHSSNGAIDDIVAKESENPTISYSSRFYIAIDVFISAGASRKFYIGEPIDDFLQFLNAWELKTPDMKIEINSKKKKEVQALDFIKDLIVEEE